MNVIQCSFRILFHKSL